MAQAKGKAKGKVVAKRMASEVSLELVATELKVLRERIGGGKFRDVAGFLGERKIAGPWLVISGQVLRGKSFSQWVHELLEPLRPEVHRFRGGELGSGASIERLATLLGQPSLFSPFSIAIISEAEALKVATVRAIAEIAGRSRANCLLILLASEGRESLTEIADIGTTIRLADLQGPALEKWIDKEVKNCGGVGIEPRAAQLLAQTLSSNLMLLQEELRKLSLITSINEPISLDTVRSNSVLRTEHDSFELVSALSQRQPALTAALCRRLVDQGLHPLQIVSFLSRCFRTLLAHKDTAPDAARALNKELTNFYFWKNLSPLLNHFSRAELVSAIQILHELDSRLKLTGLEPELTLAISMHKIAARGGGRIASKA